MKDIVSVLTKNELAAFTLRALYADYGYEQYKMSKFEEYDLYVKNKDFLVSESVITFTDTDGRLMALKPDVTLSIIKNTKETAGVKKIFYHENVYRVSGSERSYKEIMQAGLECLGEVDEGVLAETVFLAEKSLQSISSSYALEISSLDFVAETLRFAKVSEAGKAEILVCLGEKNEQGVLAVCEREGLGEEATSALKALVSSYGAPEEVFARFENCPMNGDMVAALQALKTLIDRVKSLGGGKKLTVDFSVLGNMKYYNGIAFKGFIEGLPSGVLSGGQYDNLMAKMGKRSRGVGFAVYLDGFDRLPEANEEAGV